MSAFQEGQNYDFLVNEREESRKKYHFRSRNIFGLRGNPGSAQKGFGSTSGGRKTSNNQLFNSKLLNSEI